MALSAGSRTGVPGWKKDGGRHRREMVTWGEQSQIGHFACTGLVTLTANATSTTVTDTRAGVASFIWFMPTTLNAAGEFANGNLCVQTQDKQLFVVTHTNAPSIDRTFRYVLLG